jgi:uncharacterized protein YecE (DUF72 family)
VERVRVGTSGWDYPHWRGGLYPPGLARSAWLARYAAVFDAVELNATFYRLPGEASVDRWRDGTPDGFLLACKGSRYLTHLKRLLDTGPGIERYFARVRRLRDKLGPVLWQLPPQMKPDLGRLDAFLAALPPDVRHAVEFRSAAWYRDDVAALLDRHRAAFCEHDLVDRPIPGPTGGFRYLRFHGAGARYGGRYGKARMRRVAADLAAARLPAFAFFNNDQGGHAVLDALDLVSCLPSARPRGWSPSTAWGALPRRSGGGGTRASS